MVQRDAAGKVQPGSVLNPNGRPKRTDEEKFTSVLLAVVTPERFRIALERQQRKAEGGDLEAFKYICKLLGLEIERKEMTGKDGAPLLPGKFIEIIRGGDGE